MRLTGLHVHFSAGRPCRPRGLVEMAGRSRWTRERVQPLPRGGFVWRCGYLSPARVRRVHAAEWWQGVWTVEWGSAVGTSRVLMAGESPDCCRALSISGHRTRSAQIAANCCYPSPSSGGPAPPDHHRDSGADGRCPSATACVQVQVQTAAAPEGPRRWLLKPKHCPTSVRREGHR